MELKFLPIFAFLCLLARGNASLPGEEYWESILPNTQMPKALQDLLQPDMANRSTFLTEVEPTVGDWNILYGIFNYYKRATITLNKDSISNSTIFFLHKNLHPNTIMRPFFIKSTNKASFLSRQVAQSIPFSSHNLAEILKLIISRHPNSAEAKIIKETLEECEEPSIVGEDKLCATSLESLVDFIVEKLGKINVQTLSIAAEQGSKKLQDYHISKGVKMIGDKGVVCHKMRYPYAVFYCHSISDTKVYVVPMVGVDGTRMEEVAVCHMNTSAWNPTHFAFQVLKVKPGPPICHFPGTDDTFVWVAK